MRRIKSLELLDSPIIAPADLAGNLRDITRLNAWTGNTAQLLTRIDQLLPRRSASSAVVLDIGSGAGDLPGALLAWAAKHNGHLVVYGSDRHAGVIDYARQHSRATRWLRMDALCLPFTDLAVDVTICAQMIHHLEPGSIRELLGEMRRVSRIGFVLMDLERSTAAYIGLWLLTRLTSRNRLTLHDGPLSVRRAYTRCEIRTIAADESLHISSLFPFRWVATWIRPANLRPAGPA